jgi:hypothetical protein
MSTTKETLYSTQDNGLRSKKEKLAEVIMIRKTNPRNFSANVVGTSCSLPRNFSAKN